MNLAAKIIAAIGVLALTGGAAAGIANSIRLEEEVATVAQQEANVTRDETENALASLDAAYGTLEAVTGLNAVGERTALQVQRVGLVFATIGQSPAEQQTAAFASSVRSGTTTVIVNVAAGRAVTTAKVTAAASTAINAAEAVGVDTAPGRAALPAWTGLPTTTQGIAFNIAPLQHATTALQAATHAEVDRRAAEEAERRRQAEARAREHSDDAPRLSSRGGSVQNGGHAALEAIIRQFTSAPIVWDSGNGGGVVDGGVIHLNPSLIDDAWGRYVATHEAGHIVADECLVNDKPGATGNQNDRRWLRELAVQHGVPALTIREWAADTFAAKQGHSQRNYGGPHLDLGAMAC